MNLTVAPTGVELKVLKIKGKDDQQRFLNNLGFVEGSSVIVISVHDGDLIVKVKESRVAIGKDIAKRIIVSA